MAQTAERNHRRPPDLNIIRVCLLEQQLDDAFTVSDQRLDDFAANSRFGEQANERSMHRWTIQPAEHECDRTKFACPYFTKRVQKVLRAASLYRSFGNLGNVGSFSKFLLKAIVKSRQSPC